MAKYLLLFLAGITILNLLLTLAAKPEFDKKIFNQVMLYWVSLLLVFLVAFLLQDGPTEIAFAYFVRFIPTFIMANVLIKIREIKFNWTYYLIIQALGMFVSAGLILINPYHFSLNLIPVVVSTTLPFFHPAYNTLISHRHESNRIQKILAVLFFTVVISHFNYAFFRLSGGFHTWVMMITITQFQAALVLFPLLLLDQNKTNERGNINLAIEKLAGSDNKEKVDNLYEALNDHISERNKLLIDLNEQRELNELLIRTVSHDVATPLTVINAYTDLIISGRVAEKDFGSTLEKIKKNSLAAKDMITRIRDQVVSRDPSQIIALEDISVSQILKDSVAAFEAQLKQKNISISIKPFSKDLIISGDPKVITEHIFSNALSNAIKFSNPTSIIDIKVDEDPSYISVTIKDYGQGISQDRLASEALGTTIGTQGEKGTGYGIKVAKYFMELQNGEFHISSFGKGLGTEVRLTFKRPNLLKSVT